MQCMTPFPESEVACTFAKAEKLLYHHCMTCENNKFTPFVVQEVRHSRDRVARVLAYSSRQRGAHHAAPRSAKALSHKGEVS